MNHQLHTMKINFGMIVNSLLIPCFFYGFLVALCMKFDGIIETSIFILLIPLWVIILPIVIFIVIKGVATKNSRANKCEKITLSLMVPCKFILFYSFLGGFLASFILLLLYVEKVIEKPKIFYLLIPCFTSIICLYLYMRCLIKHQRIHPKDWCLANYWWLKRLLVQM